VRSLNNQTAGKSSDPRLWFFAAAGNKGKKVRMDFPCPVILAAEPIVRTLPDMIGVTAAEFGHAIALSNSKMESIRACIRPYQQH
jgi:hypothetical protein